MGASVLHRPRSINTGWELRRNGVQRLISLRCEEKLACPSGLMHRRAVVDQGHAEVLIILGVVVSSASESGRRTVASHTTSRPVVQLEIVGRKGHRFTCALAASFFVTLSSLLTLGGGSSVWRSAFQPLVFTERGGLRPAAEAYSNHHHQPS